jgi:ADP-heptose:LPS heptosyltransferase
VKRVILRNGYSVGDIVMMTAAVRDLHQCHPGRFQTDVRTSCTELWEHNPYLTPLGENEAEVIECDYPLINRCEEGPCHYLQALPEFLGARLGIEIRVRAYRGDIHLSKQERGWYSQVHEITRRDIPFWIVAAGGKYDIPIKWWDHHRYQRVVDHFRGRIQFVQVGSYGHHHPALSGVIDLRGQTDLRELVRLVYHAQGVLCGVTSLMHLAAAVPAKVGNPAVKPCVVIAGGREPAHWEAYPGHQYISTCGALPCCAKEACWRSRVRPLGDGDERDRPEAMCLDVRGGLPRCMEMITPKDVIRRVEMYFEGGVVRYLNKREAKIGHSALACKPADRGREIPLTLSGARLACEQFVERLPTYPGGYRGRGIVICAGGVKYFTGAWVCLHRLRDLGCQLPVELWYLNPEEMDARMVKLIEPLGVTCVDASKVRLQHPVRRLAGWELKPYAILHSSFREVLYLDADNVPVRDPQYLFASAPYRDTGAVFWLDYGQFERTNIIWRSCGLSIPKGPELESGQMLIDKRRCWRALRLALWFNEHSDFYYQYLHGDKETFRLAFHLLQKAYGRVPYRPRGLGGAMCQHDFQGRRVFQHRNTDKWDFHLRNQEVDGLWHEDECRNLVLQLREVWDGGMKSAVPGWGQAQPGQEERSKPKLLACVIRNVRAHPRSCLTRRNLATTDWGMPALRVESASRYGSDPQVATANAVFLALQRLLESKFDHLLLLEGNLQFNRYLRHNLERWKPLQEGWVTLASLHNPHGCERACDPKHHCSVMTPQSLCGSPAFLLSRKMISFLVKRWGTVEGNYAARMTTLACQLSAPVFTHTPSLVERAQDNVPSHKVLPKARDFDPTWRADS